tara:strand:+ start:229 stop:933 length:705 start_codon:yes stop_codon:yes gene_type:complete
VIENNNEMQTTNELDKDQESLGTQLDDNPQNEISELRAKVDNLTNANERYENQISGLQSKIDKGLNSIRQQEKQKAESNLQKLKEDFENLDESYKPYAKTAIQAEESRLQREFADESAIQSNPVSTAEQERKEIVRDMGVDPSTPGIDYSILDNQNLSLSDRRQKFFTSVMDARSKVQAPTAPVETKPADSPPVDGSPSKSTGIPKNITELHQAFASGRMPKEEYLAQKQRMGS